jgi:hypothetical protein
MRFSFREGVLHLTISTLAALTAYSITALSALVLIRRASNRRIRFLGVSIGLLPLCEVVSILRAQDLLPGDPAPHSLEMVQLAASAFALTTVHFLNRENRDRRNADMQLRLAESAEHLTRSELLTARLRRRDCERGEVGRAERESAAEESVGL